MYEDSPNWPAGMNCFKHSFATLSALSQLMVDNDAAPSPVKVTTSPAKSKSHINKNPTNQSTNNSNIDVTRSSQLDYNNPIISNDKTSAIPAVSSNIIAPRNKISANVASNSKNIDVFNQHRLRMTVN